MMAALAGAAVGKRSPNEEDFVDEEGNLKPLETRLF